MKYILILLIFLACSKENGSSSTNATPQKQKNITETIFNEAKTIFKVNIFYETGAEPYTGNLQIINDTWDITKESMESLFHRFQGRSFEYANQISEMVSIGEKDKSTWTIDDLISLGDSIAPSLSDGATINSTVIFLNGLINDNSNVLGVHITGTRYVFVFKDVVESVGGTGDQQRYVEQATVIHELGHFIGLVNNGIGPVTDHEDSEHPHHTVNEECAMHFAVESPNQILSLLSNVITNQQLDLFEDEVKNDVDSYSP